jgi:hypothetical protein
MRYRNGNLISSADTSQDLVAASGLYNLTSQQHLDAWNSSSYSGTGTAWSTLSGSNNGSLVNGVGFKSANSGSLEFDGGNDYVQMNNPMFNPNSDFTFNAWINKDSLAGPQTIVSEGSGTGRLQIVTLQGGSIQLVKNWVTVLDTFATGTLTAETWHNVCVNRSSNTYSLYLDGTFASSFTSTESFTAGPDAIGRNNGIEYYDGRVAVVMAYDRALSASEILQNYNALVLRY